MQASGVTIGIMALQGGFELHAARVESLGACWTLVKRASDLTSIDALILPGGESSVFLKLCDSELRTALVGRLTGGMPALATCAGVIFLAHSVSDPVQESLDQIDLDVRRNAYGRQVDSFIDSGLHWTDAGRELINSTLPGSQGSQPVEAVFIRAPRITRIGPGVSSLLERDGEPVLARSGNIFAATFHPELSDQPVVHELFLAHCATSSSSANRERTH